MRQLVSEYTQAIQYPFVFSLFLSLFLYFVVVVVVHSDPFALRTISSSHISVSAVSEMFEESLFIFFLVPPEWNQVRRLSAVG